VAAGDGLGVNDAFACGDFIGLGGSDGVGDEVEVRGVGAGVGVEDTAGVGLGVGVGVGVGVGDGVGDGVGKIQLIGSRAQISVALCPARASVILPAATNRFVALSNSSALASGL
jgi:hypothetical protein